MYSSHTDIKLCTYCLYRDTTVLIHEILYLTINSGVLTSLLLPHLTSSLTDSLPSLNLLCHSKTDTWLMQVGRKAVWGIPFCGIFSKFKTEFIAYRSSKMSDSISEIPHLWQSGFSRVYSNCCCSCSFEPEIIKIGQASQIMYSNNVVNFQESTSILNAHTKKVYVISGNLPWFPYVDCIWFSSLSALSILTFFFFFWLGITILINYFSLYIFPKISVCVTYFLFATGIIWFFFFTPSEL